MPMGVLTLRGSVTCVPPPIGFLDGQRLTDRHVVRCVTDAHGKEPDGYSRTLRRYHQLLLSKPLPDGASFDLDDRLHHISEFGEFWLSSDAITNTYLRWTHPAGSPPSSNKSRRSGEGVL